MILNATGINKSYHNGSKTLSVLKNIDLQLNVGDMVSIMGQSGAGKTTLLNILGTLDTSDGGKIEICGKDIDVLSEEALSSLRNNHLGFVFQFHHLLPEFTAIENVLMPSLIAGDEDDFKEHVKELFEYVGMMDRKDHYPSQLSGGERLRVAVLRAIIRKPDIILADEPTGNLDMTNANRLLSLFKKINKDFDQAFVITTHNSNVANIGHRKYILENETLSLTDNV